ncbi:MAG: hypothetical protein A2219_08375 [Elusimicrobia bacterium RIFOXYA2_FULL_50_26]|nr:MAG: hypothetical protein A2219_08375 [Elusimicrobia bacterium RIFOXYA2_FULL_50_26]
MKKIDLKKEYKQFYSAKAGRPAIVTVPATNFLMVDGIGDPGTAQSFKEAVGTLYSISYSLKFKYKREKSIDYGVMPLEGLWWADDMNSFTKAEKDNWRWTVMIVQPDFISSPEALGTVELVKNKSKFNRFPAVYFKRLDEGLSAQILHVGPYSTEHATIVQLHEFIKENGFTLTGKHHEIYLGDPRKSAPEKLKTIIRQPVKK